MLTANDVLDGGRLDDIEALDERDIDALVNGITDHWRANDWTDAQLERNKIVQTFEAWKHQIAEAGLEIAKAQGL